MKANEVKTNTKLVRQKLPGIQVKTTKGTIKIPEDYQGKWLILFSYPGDFNFSCLEEFNVFARKNEEFKKLNAQLIGFPSDEVICKGKCMRWIKQKLKMNVPFPIITDCSEGIESIKGLFHTIKKMRVVSILDVNGSVQLRIYYPKLINIQIDEILQTLKALQTFKNSNASIIKN
jgi:peroxiredoxin (alkyl hydroperoxide reductase subunit C)